MYHKKCKRENKRKKSYYLDSHGEEAQKKPGLIENENFGLNKGTIGEMFTAILKRLGVSFGVRL